MKTFNNVSIAILIIVVSILLISTIKEKEGATKGAQKIEIVKVSTQTQNQKPCKFEIIEVYDGGTNGFRVIKRVDNCKY